MLNRMKRWQKYTGAGIAIVILIVCLFLALTQTSFFRGWLKNQIITRANHHLNGKLSIGRIDGNLFTSVHITDVLVTAFQDTVLLIPHLSAYISPWRLLHKEIDIDSITIDSPYTKLVQAPDSVWNITRLFRADSLPPSGAVKRKGTFDFRVVLDDVVLRGGSVSLVALDTALTRAVTQIGMQFNVQYSDTAQQLELKGLSFGLDKPQFRLEQLSLKVSRSGKRITLGNLVFKTARNQIGGQGTYMASDTAVSSGQLKSQSFDLTELETFLPDLNLSGHPTFDLETQLERDSLVVNLGIVEPPQRIDLVLHVAHASETFSAVTRGEVRYYLEIGLTNFSLAHWLGDTSVDFQANGTIKLSGSGFTAKDADITAAVNFSDLRVHERSIGQITGTFHYAAENVTGQLDASGEFGELKSTFNVLDIPASQHFTTDLEALHLNLSPLLQNDSLRSDINFKARVQGSGFSLASLAGSGLLDLSSSEVFGMKLDTGTVRGSFSTKAYRIDSLFASSNVGTLNMAGHGAVGGDNDLTFQLRLKSLSPVRQVLKADSLSGDGVLSGTVSGTLDSLSIASDLEMHNVRYNASGAESVSGHFSALSRKNGLEGTAVLLAHRVGTLVYNMDSLAVSTDFDAKEVHLKIDGFYRKGITAHIESSVSNDSILSASIPNIDLYLGERHWHGGSSDTRVTSLGDAYRVENLILNSSPLKSNNAIQSVSLAGLFSTIGKEDFALRIDQLDLAELTAAFDPATAIAGRLTVLAHLGGTASTPTLSAELSIDSGLVNDFSYSTLRVGCNYEDEKLSWKSSLQLNQGDSLATAGFVPINLSIAKTSALVYRDRQLDVKVKTSELPLSIIQAFGEPFKQLDGVITADISATNTLNSPTISGSVELREGKISVPKYGIEYSDILTELSVHDATLTLDTFQAKGDKGLLTGSGKLQFEKSLLGGKITATQFDLLANSFYVTHHKDYQIQVSGDAHLTGEGQGQKFSGNITVLRSSLFLPAIMQQAATAQDAANQSLSMLVKATLAPDSLGDIAGSPVIRKSPPVDTTRFEWYKNLRGQFKITIPRNTWLRSRDMNLEIGEGDIDLVKNGPDIEIFGPIKILRGQYNLYGKRFAILQGTLTFQGGAEYNPEVSIQAQYEFRTADRERRALKLDVSGKAFAPVFQFSLDDNALGERDALAYVMYGRSMDELTSGQKSDAGSAQADLAKGAAANLLSNQLSQTLGSKLGLDVIDINSQGSLTAARMTIGKYLTNNLFMSYQRSLGEIQGQEATPGVMTLEYELNKYLLLQLLQGDEKTSGFDFIFKYQH